MANPYDDLAASLQPQDQSADANPYDALLADVAAQEQQRARTVYEKSLATNPDQAAESVRLAKQTGLPADTVERNLDEVRRREQARLLDLQRLAAESPVLARQLADPTFTKQAHDDLGVLEQVGQFFKNTGQATKAGVFNTSRGAAGVFQAGAEFVAPVLDFLENPELSDNRAGAVPFLFDMPGGNPLRRLAEGFAAVGGDAGKTAKATMPRAEGNIAAGYYSGIQSLTQNLLALPMAFAPGGQGAALGMMTATTGGQSYQDAREQGLSMSQALPFAASQAAIEYATERMPLGALVGDVKAGTGLLKTLGKQLALEIPGEQIATILQDMNEWAALPENKDKPFRDYIAERPDAAAQTLVATIVGTGGNVVVARGIESATRKLMGDAYEAGVAEQSADQLQAAMQTAAQSMLRQRNPEEFRALMQRMAENTEGAPQEVYLDADVLNQLPQDVLQALPENVLGQLAEALAANGTVAIPVADVLTIAPGTPLEQALVENARVGDPMAMTQAEAAQAGEQAQQFLAQEAERVIAQAQDAAAMQASSDRVKLGLVEQLNTAGRFSPAVNEAYATWTTAFYTTMAGRLGITPEEMAGKYPLRIGAQAGQGATLEQGEPRDLVLTHNLSAENLMHAVKMGGIAVPSLAVTKKDTPLSGFGEITLIGPKEMADPKGYAGTKVFGADIYSPRYPSVERELDKKELKAFEKKFSAMAGRMGVGLPDTQDLEREGQRSLERSLAVMGQFLADNGVEPAIVMRQGLDEARAARLAQFGLDQYFGRTDVYGLIEDEQFVEKAVSEQIAAYEDAGMADKRKGMIDKLRTDADTRRNFARDTAQKIVNDAKLRARPEADAYPTQQAMAQQVEDGNLGDAFRQYVQDQLDQVTKSERIFQGFTNSGSRKYIPHTLENVVKILKKELRGGENFNYGVGSLRAKFTPQFKSVEQIRKAKDRLVSKQDFENVKKEIDDQFFAAVRAISPDLPSDTGVAIMEDAATMGVQRAAKGYGFDVSDEAAAQVAEFLTRLRELPTEYFEAKILRDVDLAEFAGAVVPEGVDPKVIEALQARGVKDIRTYKKGDEAARAAKIGEFENLFFQNQQQARATFNPQTLELVLTEKADLSSFLHETGHFFLEVMADLSSQPDAPAEIQQDMAALLKWFGVADLQTWNGYDLDQKRKYHERFAESMEQYLLEGKAPSLELAPLFRKFKRWMEKVYTDLKAFIAGHPDSGIVLSPEIRQVFDRMLATREQIAQAEEVAGMVPNEDATEAAVEKLTARSLRDLKWTVNARAREIKKLQKQAAALRKGVEAEVRAEVEQMPAFQAQDAIARVKGEPTPEQLETIAEATGFTSASEMAQAIETAGSKAAAIEGMTDQRMLEEHGDLADQRAIEEAANAAVHNEARARSLATELKAQADMLGARQDTGRTNAAGRPVTASVIAEAAKQFAANVVGSTKVGGLKARAWQHVAAERRAGKRWQEATAKGQTQDAVKAKQDQVLNNAAAKAATEAQAEMERGVEYLKKFDKEAARKKLPPEYLDQIDALLEKMDLRVSVTGREIERRASLRKWVESQRAIGLDPIVPDEVMDAAQLTSYKEMTVDELRSMIDIVKNIEHLGRLKSKLLAAKDKREFDAVAEAWAKEIRDNGGKPKPVKLEGDSRFVKFFKGAWADHRKLNSLIRQFAAGAENGEGFKALIRSMNERGTQEDVMIEKAAVALAEIHAPIEKLPGGFSGAKLYIPEIRNSLTRGGRLAVALNWGNEQNRQRVRDGDGWTDAQVEAILRTLTPAELKFVNDVWAYLDTFWPEVKAKQERVNGVVEEKVEAEPFAVVAADGSTVQMRGGYYPIKYDGDRSLKSQKQEAEQLAKDMLRGAILRPTTRRGHTQARTDEVMGRPVRKDLSVITQHVTQVVHDLAWHEWAIDANRLLNDPRISSAIRDFYGAETHRAMTDAVEAIVVGDVAKQTSIDQLLLAMRANVTRSIMGASLTTALLQPFGLTQSMARIGVVPVLKGAGRWAGDAMRMESSMKWIAGKSDFMRLRSKTFNRELREISQRVRGKGKIMQVADASLFMLMQKMQLVADVPTWIGAYEKALNENPNDEALAVQLADEAVLSSQGGGNTRDLSAVQRELPFLTQFYSYFNTTLQLVAESTAKTDFKNPRAAAGWLGDMVLLAVIPAILPALITFALKGGGEDDEPEDWAKRLAEWQASYLLGMFVGLRELPALWSPFDYGGPPAAKLINDGRRLVQQAGQGEIDDQAVLATVGFLGTALGIPTTQIIRSYKGWKAWDEGDAPVTSVLFGPPPRD